jgi:rRNA maturation endonuclease Nob1
MEREFDIAMADGEIDEAEAERIEALRQELGLSEELTDDLRAERQHIFSKHAPAAQQRTSHHHCCPHCGAPMNRQKPARKRARRKN